MGAPLTDDQMATVLTKIRAQGVTVREQPDWRTNDRGLRGQGWGPINGVMIHHTASLADSDSYASWIFHDGKAPEVPGPLCHFFIRRNGEVWIGSNGRANHAGTGQSWVRDRVVAGLSRDTAEMKPGGSGDQDFNDNFYGLECAGVGGSPDFTEAEYRAMVIVVGELLHALGFGPDVIAHSEATSNKPDDPNYDMRQVRADVDDYMAGKKVSNGQATKPATVPDSTKPTSYGADSSTVSVAHLKQARYDDPPKNGRPLGPYASEVRTMEQALAKTEWIRWDYVDGHFGSTTVGDGSSGYGGTTGFQRKHSGAQRPDGWLGRRELELLFRLAGMSVTVVD